MDEPVNGVTIHDLALACQARVAPILMPNANPADGVSEYYVFTEDQLVTFTRALTSLLYDQWNMEKAKVELDRIAKKP